MKKYKFIDLFAGIGGFHLALKTLGMQCVFTSEIDQYARKTYLANFKDKYLKNKELFAGETSRKYQTLIFFVQVFLVSHFPRPVKKKALKIIKMAIFFFQ